MVLLDGVEDLLLQAVLEGEVDALLDVGDDDERAHARGEVLVRVGAGRDVFGEVLRLDDLADVVEVGHDAAGGGVEPDGLGARFGEVGDDQAVMVGAGRLHGHLLEERVIEVGQLEPGNGGGDLEHALHQRQDGADDQRRDDAGADAEKRLDAEASRLRPWTRPSTIAQRRLSAPTAKPALIRSTRLRTFCVK